MLGTPVSVSAAQACYPDLDAAEAIRVHAVDVVRQHAGIFGPVPEEDPDLFQAWVSYYVRTERFDRSVCSARDQQGIAVPVMPWERELVSNNARGLLRELRLEGCNGPERETALVEADRILQRSASTADQ